MTKRRRGRPSQKVLDAFIKSRVSIDQHTKYIALGGSEWLRKQIDGASINEKGASQHV